jgi:hypothetical protein
MPAPLRMATHVRDASVTNLSGEHRAEPVHQNRTVSWLMSIPRSAKRSSTFRSESGCLTYIVMTKRMTSGELLKYRNGLLIVRVYHGQEPPENLL